VAQTDNIVFVYKLAQPDKADQWDKKKSICNKFLQSVSVLPTRFVAIPHHMAAPPHASGTADRRRSSLHLLFLLP
jgi:hypothetical protein